MFDFILKDNTLLAPFTLSNFVVSLLIHTGITFNNFINVIEYNWETNTSQKIFWHEWFQEFKKEMKFYDFELKIIDDDFDFGTSDETVNRLLIILDDNSLTLYKMMYL